MAQLQFLALAGGACCIAYIVFASILIVRAPAYSKRQKVLQLLLVWLIPLVGAALAHWFATAGVSKLRPVDREFEPRVVDGA
jgi:hypothetical protein